MIFKGGEGGREEGKEERRYMKTIRVTRGSF